MISGLVLRNDRLRRRPNGLSAPDRSSRLGLFGGGGYVKAKYDWADRKTRRAWKPDRSGHCAAPVRQAERLRTRSCEWQVNFQLPRQCSVRDAALRASVAPRRGGKGNSFFRTKKSPSGKKAVSIRILRGDDLGMARDRACLRPAR